MSKNKIILTSIVSIFVAMPAMAEFVNGQQIADQSGLLSGMSCNEDTLGTTSDPANIEAIWTPNTYNISYTCANGDTALVATEMSMVDCDEYPTDDSCITAEYSIYGKWFRFADDVCSENGYHQTGWSCTRDNVPNDTATVYTPGEYLQAWNIESDLTCTEVRDGNTITIDWYNSEQATTPSSTTQCTYGTTSGQGALALPAQPTAPAGYTFGGWKMIENVCERFDTSGTCNMNSSCFWYVDENTNTGTCVNVNPSINGCASANDSTSCTALGYCRWSRMTLTGIHCGTNVATICHGLNENQCNTHSMSNGCYWESSTQECITQSERDLAPAM